MTIVNEFTSAAVSDRGLNPSRPQNEDSYLEIAEVGLFAVADGVGGAQAGEVASQMAVEILAEAFRNMSDDADPEDTMKIALDRANEAIFQMSHDLPQLSSMATTIAAVHVARDIATIAHVGDSRVYRIDGNGRLFRETDDHSVVEEEVRAGRMTPEQALTHPSRNIISRALGADEFVEPDIRMVLVHPGTKFLLCSDGITRHIDDSELENLLRSREEPAEVCARMKELCYDRGAEDNLTAVVVSFPGPEPGSTTDDDLIEEVTLAGVREPADQPVPEQVRVAAADSDVLELDTIDAPPPPLHVADPDTEESEKVSADSDEDPSESEPYLIQEPGQSYADEATAEGDYAPSTEVAAETNDVPASPRPEPAGTFSYNYGDEDAPRKGGIAVGWLMAGLLIGVVAGLATGYYIVKSQLSVKPAPVLNEQKSNNVGLTSFEERRRLVDADPVKYLTANAASPQDADEFFWLGRALLLTGKPVEAKRQFEEAKKRLSSVSEPSNLRTMSNEIAMGLIIASDPALTEAFAKEVAANSLPAPDANVNSNANQTSPVR